MYVYMYVYVYVVVYFTIACISRTGRVGHAGRETPQRGVRSIFKLRISILFGGISFLVARVQWMGVSVI